jgi:hypothetical protein
MTRSARRSSTHCPARRVRFEHRSAARSRSPSPAQVPLRQYPINIGTDLRPGNAMWRFFLQIVYAVYGVLGFINTSFLNGQRLSAGFARRAESLRSSQVDLSRSVTQLRSDLQYLRHAVNDLRLRGESTISAGNATSCSAPSPIIDRNTQLLDRVSPSRPTSSRTPPPPYQMFTDNFGDEEQTTSHS